MTEEQAQQQQQRQRLKLLVLSELDGQILRVNRLCERLVSSFDGGDIDAILVSGGFVAVRAPREYEALEAVAAAEGDMMALVSRLEMIVCRVLYIPDDNDPPTARSLVVPPPTLTQYSSNVYSRAQQLVDGVVVMGETHFFNLINDSKDPTDGHDLVLVLRDSAARSPLPTDRLMASTSSSPMLLLLYRIQSYSTDALPRQIEVVGGSHHPPHASASLVFPGSFRLGQFTVLELEKLAGDGSWSVASSTTHQHLRTHDDGDSDSDETSEMTY